MASETQVPTDAYLDLVRAFPLRPITSEADYVKAIEIVDQLDDRLEQEIPGERDYFLVLCMIIERYETEIHGEPEADDE